jgi:hypothetical protein
MRRPFSCHDVACDQRRRRLVPSDRQVALVGMVQPIG